jgi:hypothetical protein
MLSVGVGLGLGPRPFMRRAGVARTGDGSRRWGQRYSGETHLRDLGGDWGGDGGGSGSEEEDGGAHAECVGGC